MTCAYRGCEAPHLLSLTTLVFPLAVHGDSKHHLSMPKCSTVQFMEFIVDVYFYFSSAAFMLTGCNLHGSLLAQNSCWIVHSLLAKTIGASAVFSTIGHCYGGLCSNYKNCTLN